MLFFVLAVVLIISFLAIQRQICWKSDMMERGWGGVGWGWGWEQRNSCTEEKMTGKEIHASRN